MLTSGWRGVRRGVAHRFVMWMAFLEAECRDLPESRLVRELAWPGASSRVPDAVRKSYVDLSCNRDNRCGDSVTAGSVFDQICACLPIISREETSE